MEWLKWWKWPTSCRSKILFFQRKNKNFLFFCSNRDNFLKIFQMKKSYSICRFQYSISYVTMMVRVFKAKYEFDDLNFACLWSCERTDISLVLPSKHWIILHKPHTHSRTLTLCNDWRLTSFQYDWNRRAVVHTYTHTHINVHTKKKKRNIYTTKREVVTSQATVRCYWCRESSATAFAFSLLLYLFASVFLVISARSLAHSCPLIRTHLNIFVHNAHTQRHNHQL